jgi:ABC-type antimicrobial peptide transport system permease subunit
MAAPAVATPRSRASHGGLLHELDLFFRIMARNRAGLVGFLAMAAIVIFAIVGSVIGSFVPAVLASLLDPVDALRYE